MLNDAQNKKLLVKLTRALEIYEPYVFAEAAVLPFTMYETDRRLHAVPDASLFSLPDHRSGKSIWGGPGRYCWFLTDYTVPPDLDGQDLYLYPELGGYEAML